MRSLSPRPGWITLLACSVVVGCQHDDRCPNCRRLPAAVTSATLVASVPLSPYAAVPSGPIAHETLKPTPVAEHAAPEHGEWQTVSGNVHENLKGRRTFTDLTVNRAFAHAPDYTWLVGELRSVGPDVWTVRFASVDEERDTVVLVDAPSMVNLRAGQLVRVEGQLVDPNSHDEHPAYRVTTIQPVAHD
jgi:hypothetical protein